MVDNRQDPQVTAQLVQILGRVPDLVARAAAVGRSGVSPGSRAATDASTPLGHHVRIQAIDRLASGVEHLDMWHRLLLAGVQPNTVHITLIRGAMEGAVTCRWLIGPEDSVERVRRGVALLLDDYANRREFEDDFGVSPDAIKPPAKNAATRIAELKAARDTAKIGPIKVPSMTYRFGGYIGMSAPHGRSMYRLLSAYAHGMQWKAMTTKFELVEGAPEVAGGRVAKVSANDEMAVMLTDLGVTTVAAALRELEAY